VCVCVCVIDSDIEPDSPPLRNLPAYELAVARDVVYEYISD